MVARNSCYIDAPVETVFDFMKTLKWLDLALMDISDVNVTADGVGTSYSWAFKIAGVRFEGFDVVTEVVPNQRITERSAGAMPATWIDTFESEGTGTRWGIEIHPESFWRVPPMRGLMELAFKRMGDKIVPRLKDRIEAASGDGSRRPQAAQEATAMKRSTHIEAPVETVFGSVLDALQDPEKMRDLMAHEVEIDEMKPTKEGAGTYFSWRGKVGGVPMRGFDVLTEVVPNKHITDKSSSAMVGRWDYYFEPEGSGTKLTFEHSPQSLWRVPPLRSLVDLATAKMTDSVMARLKDTVETSGSKAPVRSGAD